MPLIGNALVKFENYEIDRARWQLSWKNEPVPLPRKTFDLLMYLVDHADRVVGKDELLQTLWPGSFVEESNLSQQIFLLRKALSRHESGAKIIDTVPGRGYRFAAAITTDPPLAPKRMVISAAESMTRITLEEEEVDAHDVLSAVTSSGAPLPGPTRNSRAVWVGGVVLGLAALGAAGWFGWQRWLDRSGGAPVQVVLAPMDGTTGDAVLDKSLTQALRMDLAQSPYVSLVPDSTVRATLSMMTHQPDEVMTPATAREVCERTDSQSLLSGSLAKVGQHFLLTAEASSCVNGSVVGSAKYEADRLEDLPHGIEIMAATLRRKLGESRRSIARFNAPLFQGGTTASLDALKAYTQGTEEMRLGNVPKAITLLQTALAADPKFATAQYGLAAAYSSEGDDADERVAIAKAYSLKDGASRPIQFLITSAYIPSNAQDLYASLRNDENWTAVYPNSSLAWSRLATTQRDVGHYSEAVVSSQRAVAITPQNLALRVGLVTSQLQSGDLKAALATCEQTVARNLDGDELRIRYLELAYALHDPDLLRAQKVWDDAHPDAATVVLGEARIASAEGRFSEARRLIARFNDLFHQQGVGPAGDRFTKSEAVELMEVGDYEEGKRLFRSVPIDPEEGQEVVGLAYAGDTPGAMATLHTMQTKYPQGTLWNLYWGPQVRAVIAMTEHRPKDAAAILETARPVEMRELVVPRLRGYAYLAAAQPALAEKDFRTVVTHPGVDPDARDIPLSWLGLGRALAAEGNRPAAIEAYQHFLTLWAHADPDALYLKQARQEFATLQKPPPAK